MGLIVLLVVVFVVVWVVLPIWVFTKISAFSEIERRSRAQLAQLEQEVGRLRQKLAVLPATTLPPASEATPAPIDLLSAATFAPPPVSPPAIPSALSAPPARCLRLPRRP